MTTKGTSGNGCATAQEIAAAVGKGEASARGIIAHALNRAETIKSLNAFTLIDRQGALEAAERLDTELRARPGTSKPLAGVPVAIKDFTPTAGHLCTRGSWTTGNWVPNRDAVLVQRLKRAGAIVIGKTATPEFAYSSFTQSVRWGITRNAHDPSRTPGGSSGGSATAVATRCVPLAEGTDMGGSVRIPAALSGVVGMKPSLGRIPMDILPSGPDNLSHFGPLAACVDDAALFLSVAQGPHESDVLSQPAPTPIETPLAPVPAGTRVAFSRDLGYYAIDPEVERQVHAAIAGLRDQGIIVEEVSLDWTSAINDNWVKLWAVALATAWGDTVATHREHMDPDVVGLIDWGLDCNAVTYRHLEQIRDQVWRDLTRLFETYSALLTPTCALPAPPVTHRDSDYEQTDSSGRFQGLDLTCPFNLVGQCPAVSVPIGKAHNLPAGLQIVASGHQDGFALQMAKAVETVCPPPGAVTPSF